jgi:hypothetical protein
MSTDKLINSIMNYQMPNIIDRCQKDFKYTNEDMILLEKEFKRFLILCVLKKDPYENIGMYSSDVDNLWHSFILFTKEYATFCHQYAGHFIHHAPRINNQRSPEEIEASRKNFKYFVDSYEKIFGEEIHPIWLLDHCM